MNRLKATVAFVCFVLVILLFQIDLTMAQRSFIYLVISGFVGLMIGDLFLFKAFAHLGSGRVLMIFGFQPLLLGAAAYYLFGETFSIYQLSALIFLVSCIFCFSLESFRDKGHWDLSGIFFALAGVGLDAAGLLLTKEAFDLTPDLSIFVANAIRAGTTVVAFFLVSFVPLFHLNMHLKLWPRFVALSKRDRYFAVGASVLGTFLSLTFWLKAIQIGHLPTISAIAGTSPLFATVFEIYRGRKKMTGYLAAALICFFCGFLILMTT